MLGNSNQKLFYPALKYIALASKHRSREYSRKIIVIILLYAAHVAPAHIKCDLCVIKNIVCLNCITNALSASVWQKYE